MTRGLDLCPGLEGEKMKIGEVASITSILIETIRYYEREGLLAAPPRTEGNFRVYDAKHVERLSFIRHCRSLDMALDEIRVLLHFKDAPADNCGEVNALLDTHIGHVTARIRELRELEQQLMGLRERCKQARDTAHCGILNGLSQLPPQGAALEGGHVQGTHGGARPRRLEK